MQNNINHISDESRYVKFDPTGTDWPESTTNVQKALEGIGPWATLETGLPKATESIEGVSRLSTQEEVNEGLLDNTIVTPKTLNERLKRPEATETSLGVTQYATNDEASQLERTDRTITASSLGHVFKTNQSTELAPGTIKLSSTLQATQGTDDTTSMTPKKVKAAIDALTPSYGIATESNSGTVTLASIGVAQKGEAHDGVSISPKIFVGARASETKVGTTRLATVQELKSKSLDSVSISPKTLGSVIPSETISGIVKLSKTKTDVEGTALSGDADVVFLSGSNMTGRLKLNGDDYITRSELHNSIPIGFYSMASFNPSKLYGGIWRAANGDSLLVKDYKELFDRIGYTYGGSGDKFNLPNYSDIFVRGASSTRPAGKREGWAVPKGLKGTFMNFDRWRVHDWVTGAFKLPSKPRWNTNVKNGGGDNWGGRIEYNPELNGVKMADENRPDNMAAWIVIRVK